MDKEDGKCKTETFERHPQMMIDVRKLFDNRINRTNVSEAKTSMGRKISIMKPTDQENGLPRKLLETCCMTNQCKKRGGENMSMKESYHNVLKNEY